MLNKYSLNLLKLALIVFLISISFKINAQKNIIDDYTKYKSQGDSLFKISNYASAIKKYKSCEIVKEPEPDEYSTNKIKTIEEILNKLSIARNLKIAGKSIESIEIYKKVLILNTDDLESKKNIIEILQIESEKLLLTSDFDGAIQKLEELNFYTDSNLKLSIQAKIKEIDSKKITPEYLKIKDDAQLTLKNAKYEEAKTKFQAIYKLKGFQNDKNTTLAIILIEKYQKIKKDASQMLKTGDNLNVISMLETILKAGINDNDVKDDILVAYETEADKLVIQKKKNDAILLISKAIETFEGDKKRQNKLQKKLKNITTIKTKKD